MEVVQLHDFMGWKNHCTPTQIRMGNELVTSAKMIAHSFNSFFVSKVASIRSVMPNVGFSVTKLRGIMQTKNCQMQLTHVSLAKVKRL